jgi:hypothetical protein
MVRGDGRIARHNDGDILCPGTDRDAGEDIFRTTIQELEIRYIGGLTGF